MRSINMTAGIHNQLDREIDKSAMRAIVGEIKRESLEYEIVA